MASRERLNVVCLPSGGALSPDVAAALGARVGLDAVAAFLRSHADVAVQNLQPTTRIQVTEIGVCTHPESIGIGPSSNRERSRQSKNGSVVRTFSTQPLPTDPIEQPWPCRNTLSSTKICTAKHHARAA